MVAHKIKQISVYLRILIEKLFRRHMLNFTSFCAVTASVRSFIILVIEKQFELFVTEQYIYIYIHRTNHSKGPK